MHLLSESPSVFEEKTTSRHDCPPSVDGTSPHAPHAPEQLTKSSVHQPCNALRSFAISSKWQPTELHSFPLQAPPLPSDAHRPMPPCCFLQSGTFNKVMTSPRCHGMLWPPARLSSVSMFADVASHKGPATVLGNLEHEPRTKNELGTRKAAKVPSLSPIQHIGLGKAIPKKDSGYRIPQCAAHLRTPPRAPYSLVS